MIRCPLCRLRRRLAEFDRDLSFKLRHASASTVCDSLSIL
jgi:hypothetical protein